MVKSTQPGHFFAHFAFCCLLFFQTTRLLAQCNPDSDSMQLVSLFIATNGNNWTVSTNWLEPDIPIGQWHGVTTNANGCVVLLELDSNNLTGTLPAVMAFPGLLTLRLDSNRLSGSVPNFVMPNLLGFSLRANLLSGSIPNFNLPKLQWFQLDFNQLTGNLPNFNLPNLQGLDVDNNKLDGSIPAFNFLTKLEFLDLHDNMLTGTIPNLNHTKLKWLRLQNNQLSGSIPAFNLPNLRRAYLQNNKLSGCFPAGLSALCPLGFNANVNADGYNFTNNPMLPWAGNFSRFCGGEAQLGAFCNDGSASTSGDAIQPNCSCAGTPSGAAACDPVSDSLELVKLFNATGGAGWTNKANWLVPGQKVGTWYGVTVNGSGCVTCLDLDGTADNTHTLNSPGNGLTGSIPNIALSSLTKFICSYNQLIGNIPNFSSFVSIDSFFCSFNKLTGPIPDFSNLPNLSNLNCSFNQLTGSIPDFSNLPNLTNLNCSFNQLTGLIPNFSNLPNLSILNCSFNQLNGEIPDFSNLPNLKSLWCFHNQLSGQIPDFSNLPKLQELQCFENKLSDTIPNFLLPRLSILDCHANELVGAIPSLSNSLELIILSCYSNRLSGLVPNFSNHLNLLDLKSYENLFTMEDILPNKSTIETIISLNCVPPYFSCKYQYSPQDSVFHDTTLIRAPGTTLDFSLDFDETITTNIYRWFKDGQFQFEKTGDNNLTINNLSANDAGAWQVQVTNPGAPQLTLFSRKIMLQIQRATCLVTNTNDSGPGSLREAINCANSNPGPDTIRFDIPGAGPHVISPTSKFPFFSDDNTVLDATTQPAGTIILDGSNASIPTVEGMLLSEGTDGFEVYGIVLRNATAPGLRLKNCQNFKIGAPGKGIAAYSNCRGFTGNDGTNVIVWNGSNGQIQSSRFGITENDAKPAQNPSFVLTVSGQNILVGGERDQNEGNLLGNATRHALGLWGDAPVPIVADDILIYGNNIGTGATGAEDFGGAGAGIFVSKIDGSTQIGDSDPQHFNIIKNHDTGIFTEGSGSVTNVLNNRFSCNASAGIGFAADAFVPATPVIVSVSATEIQGTSAGADDRIDIYRHDPTGCPGSPCQGAFYLGSAASDAAGHWVFPGSFSTGELFTATYTAADGHTSAFSACQSLSNSVACTTVTNTNDFGPGSLREAINCANQNPGPDTIRFDISGAGPYVIFANDVMPQITDDSLVIDATTQNNWFLGQIILDGSIASSPNPALDVFNSNGFFGFELYGLVIRNFPGNGLNIYRCQNVRIGVPNKGNAVYSNGKQSPFFTHQITLQECVSVVVKANAVGVREDFHYPTWPGPAEPLLGAGIGLEGQNVQIGGLQNVQEANIFGSTIIGLNCYDNLTNGFQPGNYRIEGNHFGGSPAEDWANLGSVGVRVFDNVRDVRIEQNWFSRSDSSGVQVSGNSNHRVLISRCIFSGNKAGIQRDNAATPFVPPIVNASSTPQKISGMAAPGTLVEVFVADAVYPLSLAECQGFGFLGQTTADATGKWTLNAPFANSLFAGSYVTATATFSGESTSEFSECLEVSQGNACLAVSNTNDSGPGSLREAINCANSNPGPDTIKFQIPGNGPHVISLNTILPIITDNQTLVDATTQTNWSLGQVVIEGSNLPSAVYTMEIYADSCAVFGLYFRNCPIGLGIFDHENVRIGRLGGENAFSGPESEVGIDAAGIENCDFEANIVGVNPLTLTKDSPQMCCGIRLGTNGFRQNNMVRVVGNTVGGIKLEAIHVEGANIEVRANFVGTDATGTLDLGNNASVTVYNPSSNRIRVSGNTMAFSVDGGVSVNAAQQVDIYNNSIFCNQNGGIQLRNGANANMPKPQITSATPSNISGSCASNRPGRIEIFKSDRSNCPNAACEQGKVFLAWAAFSDLSNWSISGLPIAPGDVLTATATSDDNNFDGNTSEFSDCFRVCEALNITLSGDSTLCPGQSATLTANGGTTFQWSPGGQTTPQIQVNAPGIFSVSVADADGCTASRSVTVTQYPASTSNLAPTLCPGETLSLGGQIFSEANPNGQATLPGAAANGCDSIVNVNLQFWPSIGLSAAQDMPVSGPGIFDGKAKVSISGGAPPFLLAWSGSAGGSQSNLPAGDFFIQNLTTGNYSCTVTDANGCTRTTTFFISDCPVSVVANVQDVLCFGQNSGAITLNLSGGSNLVFKWSNGATTQNLTNIPAGNYSVTVTDAGGAGCSVTMAQTLSQPPALLASAPVETCQNNDSEYVVQFAISGGAPPYSVNGGAVPGGATFLSQPIPSGAMYSFSVGDANGCSLAPAISGSKNCDCPVTVIPQALPNLACSGDTISIGEFGTGGSAWNWTGPGGFFSIERNFKIGNANATQSGPYTVIVTGPNGCTVSGSVAVDVLPKYQRDTSVRICAGEVFDFCGAAYDQPGTYTCSLQTLQGCDSIIVFDLSVLPAAPPRAASDSSVLPPGEDETSIPISENDVPPPANFDWVFAIETPPAHGTAIVKDNESVLYTLTDKDFAGRDSLLYKVCLDACSQICDSAWAFVFVQNDDLDDIKKDMGNVLTPDSNGKNDLFDPVAAFEENNLVVLSAKLSIFARWGERVYFEESARPTWNGRSANGEPFPQATYYFSMEAEVGASAPMRLMGTLAILR